MNLANITFGHVLERDGEFRWSGVDADGGMLDGRLCATEPSAARAELEGLFAELAQPPVQLDWSEVDSGLEFHVRPSAQRESVTSAS